MISICFLVDFDKFRLLFQIVFPLFGCLEKSKRFAWKTSNICVLIIGNSFEVIINTENRSKELMRSGHNE